ncbi:MAG: Clp protease ClpP [Acidobacteriota bacterium]|nr:Clp protease ClpP [Acidobacteriota bacterium]
MKKNSRASRQTKQSTSKSNTFDTQPQTAEPSEIPVIKQGIYSEYLNRNLNINQIMEERKVQLKRISQFREDRAILVYAADFRKANIAPTHINSLDIMPINDQLSILEGNRLDFILETSGGFGDVAEEIVKLIRNKFQEVNIIVPGTAKSAGTIIAMAGDDILMEAVSALGPIDAQISYQGKQFSAEAFIKGLDDIKEEVIKEKGLNQAYVPILQAISPGEIRNAKNAMEFAQVLVREWLVKYKFKNWTHRARTNEEITSEERSARAFEIAEKLSQHSEWLTHSRSIKIDDLRKMELIITDYSDNEQLADAIRRYYILLQLTFEKSNIYKIYETPDSQIINQVNIPNAIPPQQMVPAELPQEITKNTKALDVDINCGLCGTINKFQARFSKSEPLKPGFKNFPVTNKFKCLNCQTENDMTVARNQIEKQFGKKIVS